MCALCASEMSRWGLCRGQQRLRKRRQRTCGGYGRGGRAGGGEGEGGRQLREGAQSRLHGSRRWMAPQSSSTSWRWEKRHSAHPPTPPPPRPLTVDSADVRASMRHSVRHRCRCRCGVVVCPAMWPSQSGSKESDSSPSASVASHRRATGCYLFSSSSSSSTVSRSLCLLIPGRVGRSAFSPLSAFATAAPRHDRVRSCSANTKKPTNIVWCCTPKWSSNVQRWDACAPAISPNNTATSCSAVQAVFHTRSPHSNRPRSPLQRCRLTPQPLSHRGPLSSCSALRRLLL